MNSSIKEVVEKLGIYSEMLKFVSGFTVYEDNNGSIVVVKFPGMTPMSTHIYV